jgi:hypothetical protein
MKKNEDDNISKKKKKMKNEDDKSNTKQKQNIWYHETSITFDPLNFYLIWQIF